MYVSDRDTHLLFYVISKNLGVAASDCGKERITWYKYTK